MLLMAKPKPRGQKQAPPEDNQHQFHLRLIDEALPDAIGRYAESTRRSKNMAINILIEEGLARAGFWPPKSKTS